MAEVYYIKFPDGRGYVGITNGSAERRFREHQSKARNGSSLLVHKAIRKHGGELTVLAQGVTWAEAKRLEIEWIARLGTRAPAGYNMTTGGQGTQGRIPTAKHRRAVGAAARRMWADPEYRERQRQAVAEASRRRWADPDYRAKVRHESTPVYCNGVEIGTVRFDISEQP